MPASLANSTKVSGQGVSSLTTAAITSTSGGTFIASYQGPIVTVNTPTDSKSNAYTLQESVGISQQIFVYTAENGTGGASHTCTITTATAPAAFTVYFCEAQGVSTSSVDAAASVAGDDSASPFTLTSGTLAQANNLALAYVANPEGTANPHTFTEGSGFTKAQEETDVGAYYSSQVAWKVTSSTAALATTWTSNGGTSEPTELVVLVLKESVAGWNTTGTGPRSVPLLGGGPIGAGPVGEWIRGTAAAGGNVTVGLTGVSSSGAIGALSVAISKALGGLAGSTAIGLLAPSLSVALAGQQASGVVGALMPTLSILLAGNGAASTVGNLTAGHSVALAGVAGTGGIGTPTPGTAVTPAGQQAAGQIGALSPALSVGLAGAQGAGAAGALTPNTTVPLGGVQGTGQFGTLGVQMGGDVTVALSGVQALGQAGVLVASIAVLLPGQAAAGQVGSLTPSITNPNVTVALTGVSGAGQIGTITPSGGDVIDNRFVRHADDDGVVERFVGNGDGTHSLVLTTVDGAGKDVISRHYGLRERFVLQGDGSHARLVATGTLGGADRVVRHPIDGAIHLRYIDLGGGLYAEKITTSGATGSDMTVRIVEDNGVPQRYVFQGDGTWARLVATAGATGPVVTNAWDGFIFERWTPNGDGTYSQRVTLL